jgi:DNA modification methylase
MSFNIQKYEAFLKNKVRFAESTGLPLDLSEINPALKPHNKLMVKWLVEGGRRACFAAFGLHKTVTQLEVVRITLTKTGGRALIICPLGVRQEFKRDAIQRLGWVEPPKFIRRIEEAGETGIYMTNYETIRDGKMDPRLFNVASLDEASCLRGFGGSKTFREFMRLFTGDAGPNGDRRGTDCVPYRFVATATPSPNEYIELLCYADFLGIMDVSQAKTRFFKRDSTKADKLTIHPHKEEEFWLWVASWALFVAKPSDLTGDETDDLGYNMPDLDIRWHELPVDHSEALPNKKGEYQMFREANLGVSEAAKEKRDSVGARITKLLERRQDEPDAHRIIWHDRDDERDAIAKAIKGIAVLTGAQDLEKREQSILDFSDGLFQELAAKPVIAGSGCNFQRHCHWGVYLGIGFRFNDFIQSVHRLLRFLQEHRVRIDLIYMESERSVRKSLERKWEQDKKLRKKMTEITKQYGLTEASLAHTLTRKMGVERIEVTGQNFKTVHGDAVLETARLENNSIGLILTSIPFSTQYEYSPNFADFGHSENNNEFWQQMDFLTPSLVDKLMPGRICAIHVKDRIIPGGLTGLGFQTVYPFHVDAIEHYTTCPDCRLRIATAKSKGERPHRCTHRFEYIGMKTIVTDVVRENNQTYRLGWTEQCKDGSKMGVGMPEYLLLFRKTPTDTTNAYADIPVLKDKPMQELEDGTRRRFINKTKERIVIGTGYSRARWQLDAHGFTRSQGDRLITPEELAELEHDKIFKMFRNFSIQNVYDFEHHVRIGETLEAKGKLPVTFMLLQPQSWSNEVWTDITRMITLNTSQATKGKESHLCPMQFDIADRVIAQMSNPGDKVLDPFGGLMTVPYRAIKAGRFGIGFELKQSYFMDGVQYCRAAENNLDLPTLFDVA